MGKRMISIKNELSQLVTRLNELSVHLRHTGQPDFAKDADTASRLVNKVYEMSVDLEMRAR